MPTTGQARPTTLTEVSDSMISNSGTKQSAAAQYRGTRPGQKASLPKIPSTFARYALAVLSVALAVVPALLLQHYGFHRVELSLFLFAIAIVAWYAGVGAATVSVILSILCFLYLFSPPIYSFAFSVADVPAIVILLSFGVLTIRFSAVRRRTEEQLLCAQDELRAEVVQRTRQASLLNLTHDAIFVRDMSANITYWNRGAKEMYGWTAQEACGKITHELLQTVFPIPLEQIEADLTDTGRWQGELVHISKNGTPVVVASRWSLQQDNEGTPTAILEINNDISEQKRAEEARREMKEQWRAAFESNPTMFFVLASDGTIANVNAFGAEQLGYTATELVGQSVLNIFYEPDRLAVQKRAKECFDQPGRMMRWEARKIRKDGTVIWVRETANAVVLKERPVLLVVCEDITEQKRAEEAARRSEKELRDLIDTMPTMAWIALPDGSNAFVTRQWFQYTGLSAEQSSGAGWESTIHPEDFVRHIEEWQRSLASGQPFEHETRLRRAADGQYRWFLIRGVPLRGEQGNISKWYGIATDIEDRKRAEEALQRNEAYLAEAQKLSRTGSWAFSPVSGKTHYWSDEMFRIWGFDPQQGPPDPQTVLQRIHPHDRERMREIFERGFGGRLTVEVIADHRIMLPDGTVKNIHGISYPVFDEAGRVVEYVGTAIDVTERKQSEEALRRSEAYLTESQRLTHTGSWAWDPRRERLIYCSEELFRIFGFDPPGAVPPIEMFGDRVHPKDRERWRWEINDESAKKKEHTFEYRLLLPDRAMKYVVSIRHPVFDRTGELVEVIGTTIDITERKRAEEELRKTETRFRTYVDNATDALLVHDEEGTILEVNQQACVSLGYTREELIGMHPRVFNPAIDSVAHRGVRERLEAGEPFTIETSHRRKDGTVFPVEVRPRPFWHGGRLFSLALVRDITDRKRAEEELRATETRFRTSVDHLTDALFIHDDQDDEGRIIDVNQQACESLRYTREELIGMTAFDYDVLVDATSMRSIKERIAGGEIFSFESVHRRKDGTEFPVEVRVRRFVYGDHRFGLALARDITDRKRAEEERERLRQLEADLAHMNRVSMMGELAASLAHEIKQPLSGVVVNANACLRWLAGDSPNLMEARENARRIARDGKRAGDIIGRIQALAKKTAPAMTRLDINEGIQEVITLAQSEVGRNEVTVRAELAYDLSPVLGDRVQLQQVVLNLVMNAVEAMTTVGDRELIIRTQNDDADVVRITVQDSGIGLDPQSMERIFDAFYTTKSGGMGMGLSICRSIVRNHGGRLWAVANDGPGTTFQFTLQKYDIAIRNSVA